MTLNTKIGGPFGIPDGRELRVENGDGVMFVNANGQGTQHNVYDGANPFPLLIPGDYENTRAITPSAPDPYRGDL